MLKRFTKKIFRTIALQTTINECNFYWQYIIHFNRNNKFKLKNPTKSIPPNRDLFETFKLNYELFFTDGQIAAKEIIAYYHLHSSNQNDKTYVLDWGCGVGRIIQHTPLVLQDAICYGADINKERIEWNRLHIPNILFDVIEYKHLPYPSSFFNLVYGISVLTHIHKNEQLFWLKELKRIMQQNAIAIISTHGKYYFDQLSIKEQMFIETSGSITNEYKKDGHHLLTTYNDPITFRTILEQLFKIKASYEGKSHPEKLGGQDLWIVMNV